MSHPDTVTVLKTFANKITTSSLKERRQILQDLIPCVSSEDFGEQGQRGVLKLLLLTLGRYFDNKSRRAVDDVIQALAETHGQALLKNFVLVLGEIAELQKKLSPCAGNSGSALSALTWSCMVVRLGLKKMEDLQGDQFVKLVGIQSLLVHGSFAAQKVSITTGAYNRLKRMWKEVPGSVKQYCVAVTKAEADMYQICMICCIIKFLAKAKDHETLKAYKAQFIEVYVKAVLGSRTRVPLHVLEACKELLCQLDHEEFRSALLPAVQKSMLRNPEIILQGVCEMLGGLTIDLSQYALDLGKPLATQLHSQEEEAREIAAGGSRNLARQCSDPGSIEKLVKHYFAVLNGSEGKLTVVAQRMGMLTGVGNLSFNTVSSGTTVQNLSGAVAEFFIPVLQQEVHEATLVHVLSMFSLWCAKFTTEVPEKVIEWFKKGIALKTSTSPVRNAYIQCMNAAFHGDTLIQGVGVLPLLLQTLEKAKAQPTQGTLVTEALSAACLLAKLSLSDIQAESKMGPFWNIVLDMNKQLFVNDKFLASASEEALQSLATLIEKLILDHPQKMHEKNSRLYYRAMVYVLTRGSYQTRKHAASSVKKMLSALGGAKLAVALLTEFRHILKDQQLPDATLEMENGSEGSNGMKPRVLYEALLALTSIPSMDSRDSGMVAIEALVDSHHPCIACEYPSAWKDIVSRLKVDPGVLVTNYMGSLLPLIKDSAQISQSLQNAIKTLVAVAPKAVLPRLVELPCSCFEDPALLVVSRDDYGILQTPAGELYDKSILEGASKTDEKQQNIRRENKLYSYKEQLAEIELRKELEAKKRAKGGGGKEELKLTKKQQEAMAAKLEEEAAIRFRMQELDEKLVKACAILSSCIHGNPEGLHRYMPRILKCVVPLLQSPLGAPRVKDIFLQLRHAAFDARTYSERLFALLVAQVTLRLLEPECYTDDAWSQEPIKSQVVRAVRTMHHTTVEPEEGSTATPYSASNFCYIFYMLQALVKRFHQVVGKDDALLLQVLSIISVHAGLRESTTNVDDISTRSISSSMNDLDEVDETGPELLPREEMLKLLVSLVSTHTGRVQAAASSALQQVCQCASGEEGCTAAEMGEINALLLALQAPSEAVREAALLGLLSLVLVLPSIDTDYTNAMHLAQRVWVAKYDVEQEIRKLAERLWTEAQLDLIGDLCTMLLVDVVHEEEVVRTAAAEACAVALKHHPDYIPAVLQQLLQMYEEKLYLPPPVLDNFGRIISEAPPDKWPARCGIAMALTRMSPLVQQDSIEMLLEFFVQKALRDRNESVRQKMLEAAVAAVNDHGKDNVTTLLPVFEEFLAQAPDSASYDSVRQSVVILMGSLAKHLDKDDPKVKPIVNKLITALGTPSQQVQEAVANCLPPLVPAIKADAPELVQKLLQLLLESDNYGERKGAAYGLAGLVKGLGILALKQLDIMTTLTNAIQNKKNHKHREGALFAFEMLCLMLGRLFEPYVVHLLPHLLLCFGDGNQYVREAADDTAKAVMKNLSAHGVKLVLPSLLTALETDSWRTKTGSVELLGAMAFCAPKQLSACLPNIVPKLIDVLTDSHMKVQKSGAQALKQIGSVIKNPEIKDIVPVLLDALQDPTKKTTVCLQCLLDTKFVHFIDAPSLALIMPVVQRAFQDRSTETRKMAAQIIGNMYSLTDQKDLSPYLPTVIPGLKQSLLDPVPEVRSVSARALGAIVKGMGESGFDDLLPWLMETLTSDQSSVDRSGAAQGLSEVVGGLGLQKLEKLMPEIIQTAERADIAPHVRDGYIMMYIFLPSVFGDEFIQFVGPIIPSILKALADEAEFVRDTALKAGQRIVNLYADTAIALLLPELENGLFDDNWRIRFSSVQLLGDLLYRISGVTGKMSTQSAGDDDNFGTETSQQAIMKALGPERRNRVLAGLYMGRSDTALMVRQSALHVWKVIVTHTPKTLRQILPTLFQLLLGCLASNSYDKRQVAARTLGDIVRKLGEKVLPEIIPILENGLQSERPDQRQGVCIGLSEIMSSTSKEHVLVFADSLIPTVRKALIDPLPEVREAAADTFDNLHANIGVRALDDILPDLLEKLGDDDLSEYALDGLKQVMAVKGRVVLPYLVPQLTATPVNTRALASLTSVAGEALTRHLSRILPALMSALSSSMGTEHQQQELHYCEEVVLSVQDEAGLRTVMDELLAATTHKDAGMRCAAATILHVFCQNTKLDYLDFVPQLLRGLVHMFIDENQQVLEAAWQCLSAVTKSLDASDMLTQISNLRQAIRFAVSDASGPELPGFCLPKKGITPILPIFREGILNGPPELKESAAVGLGEVIRRTSAEALKPSVVNITGPLIRILGERYSFNVRVAVLETLGLLLGKCGAMLKAFLPQLQTTFVKALNDSNRSVRLKAASALGKLIVIHIRVDPLFNELHTGVKNAEEPGIRDTMLQALRVCICGAANKMGEPTKKTLVTTLEGLLSVPEDTSRMVAAGCLGAMCQCLKEDQLSLVLNINLLDYDTSQNWETRHGRSVALFVALKEATDKLLVDEYEQRVVDTVLKVAKADRIPICLAGLRAIGYLARFKVQQEQPVPSELVTTMASSMKHEANDVKQMVAHVSNFLASSVDKPLDSSILKQLVPALVNGTKEKNTVVRTSSESALVAVLRINQGDAVLQMVMEMLEPSVKEALKEVVSRALRKAASKAEAVQDIDDTLLT